GRGAGDEPRGDQTAHAGDAPPPQRNGGQGAEAMSAALLGFLANGAWQPAIVGGLGLLFGRQLRPARLRFQFLAVTLAVAAAAPLLSLLSRQARSGADATRAPTR